MALHPAISEGRVAVVTGGASGIGLAAAERFLNHGMKVVLADIGEEHLAKAAAQLDAGDRVTTVLTDVASKADVEALRQQVYDAHGDVAVLMNNAAIGTGGGPFENYDNWQRLLGVNLWGVINGVQVFSQAMIDQGTPAAIVNTGSKQGITCPPGNTAYNVSKAGVKVLTEALQHELRNREGCLVSAHLLVPGWTHTGITSRSGDPKPDGAWTAGQVVDMLFDRMAAGDFYIICPDNEVSSEMDALRIRWGAGDVAENRPPLSRWHPDYADAFADFVRRESGGS